MAMQKYYENTAVKKYYEYRKVLLKFNIKMKPKVLISTRIEDRTLDKIEGFVKKSRWYKRNRVISSVLTAIFDNFSDEDILKMVRYDRFYHPNCKGSFELNP